MVSTKASDAQDLLAGIGEMPKREAAPTVTNDTTPEPKSTANSRGGDQTLDVPFRAELRKLIDPESGPAELRGALIKQVAQADPRNLADAQHVVMERLAR